MKTILVCSFLLYPTQGQGFNTTIVKVDYRRPDVCQAEALRHNTEKGKKECFCEKRKSGLVIRRPSTPKGLK